MWVMVGIFSSCSSDNETPAPPTPEPAPTMADRTVLVYIAGDNDLSSYASDDLKEMVAGIEKVNTKKNNLIVYMDRGGDPQLIRLCKNTNNEVIQDTLKSYSPRNSVGVTEMQEVLTQVYDDYPASSYGLTLWSHADGWLPATAANKLQATTRYWGVDGGFRMDIFDLHTALQAAPHLDFVLFDACFMQSVEVTYELRDCADYFIGSPTEIPGPGAPYTEVVPAFFSSGTAETVSKNIAEQYYAPYEAIFDASKDPTRTYWPSGVSVGVIKSSQLENLAMATRSVLESYITSGATVDVSGLFYYGKSSWMYYFTDFKAFVDLITDGNEAAAHWQQAFDAAMISFKTTPMNYSRYVKLFSMEGSCGLSVYVPCRSTTAYRTSYNAFYAGYQWYTDVGWGAKGW